MRRLASSILLVLASVAPALAADAVPFKGTWTGSTISAVQIAPDQVFVVAAGPGQATIVGKFVMTAPHITFLANFGVEGTHVFVAPNGDTLNATFNGVLVPNAEGNLEGILPATIVGGTGRFAGATGSYAFHIIARPAAFGFDSTATSTYSPGTTIVESPLLLNSLIRDQVLVQPCLRLRGQTRERLVHRTVPGPEHVNPVLRRTVPEHEIAIGRVDVGRRGTEQVIEVILQSPSRRRRERRGRRRVAADHREQPPDESARRPVRQADASVVAADAQQCSEWLLTRE